MNEAIAVCENDYRYISQVDFIDWTCFKNKTFVITGSTGLIGSNLVKALLFVNGEKNLNIRLILPVRNAESALLLFGDNNSYISIIPYTLGKAITIEEKIDFIIHLASPTDSMFFKEQPVDTMLANIEGVKSILELSKEKKVIKTIVMSTMEVYGFPEQGHAVTEKEIGSFEPMNARNSYPISKLSSEALSYAYYSQYAVPVAVIRATQTFGPGVKYSDRRVFAEFMRCAMNKTDIVLKSEGLTERAYLYTADAVTAIMTVLQKGLPGEAYTVANPDTYCSIREMAQLVANAIAEDEIKVVYDIEKDISKLGYAETIYMQLDISKLLDLGWKPHTGLIEMYKRMMKCVMK